MNYDIDEDGLNLLRASMDGDLKQVQHYIEVMRVSPTWNKMLPPEDINSLPEDQNEGCSAIHLAAWFDNIHILQYLIDCGVHVNLTQKRGSTALHYAAWGAANASVEFLLTNNADYKIQDAFGRTALHDAINIGKVDTVKFMYEYIQKKDEVWLQTVHDVDDQTLLHHAIAISNNFEKESQQIVAFLLDKGFDIKRENGLGYNSLTEACLRGKFSIVCQIIEHYRKNGQLEELQQDLVQVLLRCAKQGKTYMLSKLIELQHVPILSVNEFSETVFHKAAEGGRTKTLDYLLNYINSHKIPVNPLHETQTDGFNDTDNFHTAKTVLELKDDEDRNVFLYAMKKAPQKQKKQILHYLLRAGCEKPQSDPVVWSQIENLSTKPLLKWITEQTDPVKHEEHKRKMEEPTGMDKRQAANLIQVLKRIPFSKRRKVETSFESPEAAQTEELKEEVVSMKSTIQTLQSQIMLLTQELELCKQTVAVPPPSKSIASLFTFDTFDNDFDVGSFPIWNV